jgi:hypothetical protein
MSPMSLKSTLLPFNIFSNPAEMFNISPVYPLLLTQVSAADRALDCFASGSDDASETSLPMSITPKRHSFCVSTTLIKYA